MLEGDPSGIGSERHEMSSPSRDSKNTYHKRSDIILQQGVDELVIELDAFRVDRVVPASEGDDARPRKGESVRLHAVRS